MSTESDSAFGLKAIKITNCGADGEQHHSQLGKPLSIEFPQNKSIQALLPGNTG